MKNIDKKIAVIFPDIGYHADKPLLYYAIDIADFCGYEHICVNYGELNARQIVYTPIQETLSYYMENAIVFHGTKDSWCKTKDLKEVCTKNHNQLWILEDANHSLEVNSTMKNIDNLKMIMKKTEDYIKHRN